ncbi:methylated-DNA--[protein]-cysteine S-methyltransferase [Fundidesulfovibrio putealis]|uniref:methylated-DNA--[protein]-cysteine S-methyltransferase n=1 Tax=Fundidesulfovibrio putealis TaxID=270496 RepID=UPI0004029F18|nr:methylated-DNA--[protein]-cysteine S-methyltransferase [Fundidesulfovibrio putealis]
MNIFHYNTDIGEVGIAEQDGKLTNIFFEADPVPVGAVVQETQAIREAHRQLARYFAGELREFSLPLAPQGTQFLRAVWDQLRAVAYGQTATYSQIAQRAGNPRAIRAVGLACARNPLPLVIPCHRILGSSGKLTGYRGGLALKQRLLEMEKQHADISLRTG